ncbi:unnamed protein product [Paramecium octaurelia]|uniref:Uncharacterized protein n=1 Tax=Paramecium octaurelia TaxID=43137 RepID=A0A8S1YMK5_PAROT|nr:unnamed protein product [Paramecium octaurelia]
MIPMNVIILKNSAKIDLSQSNFQKNNFGLMESKQQIFKCISVTLFQFQIENQVSGLIQKKKFKLFYRQLISLLLIYFLMTINETNSQNKFEIQENKQFSKLDVQSQKGYIQISKNPQRQNLFMELDIFTNLKSLNSQGYLKDKGKIIKSGLNYNKQEILQYLERSILSTFININFDLSQLPNKQSPLIQNKIKIMDSLKQSRNRQFEKKVEQEEQVGRFRRTVESSQHRINGVPSKYMQGNNCYPKQPVKKIKQDRILSSNVSVFSIKGIDNQFFKQIQSEYQANQKMGKLLYLILTKNLKGHRLNFIDNYPFTYQPFWKNYMNVFEMKSSNKQYVKTKDIPVEDDLDYGFILNNIQNQNGFFQLSLAKM